MRTITVTGEGRATVTPDVAQLTIGVRVHGRAAQAVLAAANERAAALIASLRDAGLTDADLATSGISLYPQYGAHGSRDEAETNGYGVNGYEASNTLTVTVRDITRTGEIVDLAAAAAGEHVAIHGISFGVADPEPGLGTARAAAIGNARRRAAEYAAAAGLTVGEIVAISEGSSGGGPAPFLREAKMVGGGGVPLETGTTELTATVSVVFEVA